MRFLAALLTGVQTLISFAAAFDCNDDPLGHPSQGGFTIADANAACRQVPTFEPRVNIAQLLGSSGPTEAWVTTGPDDFCDFDFLHDLCFELVNDCASVANANGGVFPQRITTTKPTSCAHWSLQIFKEH